MKPLEDARLSPMFGGLSALLSKTHRGRDMDARYKCVADVSITAGQC